MDPLTALRKAIMDGREGEIAVGDDKVTICGVPYAATAETAFKARDGSRYYKLLSLWLMYQLRDKAYGDYMKHSGAFKLGINELVVVTDKKAVLDYLTGASAGIGHIDTSLLRTAGGAVEPAGAASRATATGGAAASGGASFSAPSGLLFASYDDKTLEGALAREITHRSRSSVLDAPAATSAASAAAAAARTLKDRVFSVVATAATGGAGASASASASAGDSSVSGKKRSRSDMSSSASSTSSSTASSSASSRGSGSSGDSSSSMAHMAGTPIILIPPSATTLLNIYNAAAFLQDGTYLPPAEAKALYHAANPDGAKPTKITIKRTDSRGVPCQYHIVDNAALLGENHMLWPRVVAVFATGQDWQFKGWRAGRKPDRPDITPAEIFERCAGFFLGYENDTLPENIGKWHVKPLFVSRTKRYLDAGVSNAFWAEVDAHIFAKKPYLLKRSSSSSGSSVASGGSGSSGGSGARA